MVGNPDSVQKANQQRPGQPECVVTLKEEVLGLHNVLNLADLAVKWLDPFCGTGTIAKVLRQKHLQVVNNDVNQLHPADYHSDALQPGFYKKMLQKHEYQAIITSPWWAVLDIAVPLLAAFAKEVAWVHVPSYWFFDATEARGRFLYTLQQQGRLLIVGGLARGPMGRRSMWLGIFADKPRRDKAVAVAHEGQIWLLTTLLPPQWSLVEGGAKVDSTECKHVASSSCPQLSRQGGKGNDQQRDASGEPRARQVTWWDDEQAER